MEETTTEEDPDWVSPSEGIKAGDELGDQKVNKDASGHTRLPIPEGCLRVDPVRVANGQSGPGSESESSPGPAV